MSQLQRVNRELEAYIEHYGKEPKYILVSETVYMVLRMEIKKIASGGIIDYGATLTEFHGIPVVVISDCIGVY